MTGAAAVQVSSITDVDELVFQQICVTTGISTENVCFPFLTGKNT